MMPHSAPIATRAFGSSLKVLSSSPRRPLMRVVMGEQPGNRTSSRCVRFNSGQRHRRSERPADSIFELSFELANLSLDDTGEKSTSEIELHREQQRQPKQYKKQEPEPESVPQGTLVVDNNAVRPRRVVQLVNDANVDSAKNEEEQKTITLIENRKRRRAQSVDLPSPTAPAGFKRTRALSSTTPSSETIFSGTETPKHAHDQEPFVVVMDTCGLLHPKGIVLLRKLQQAGVDTVIPQTVMSELDGLKGDSRRGEAATASREASWQIHEYTNAGSKICSRHLHIETKLAAHRPIDQFPIEKNDDKILRTCLHTHNSLRRGVRDKVVQVIVVTEDKNLSINVNGYRALGISSSNVEMMMSRLNRVYSLWDLLENVEVSKQQKTLSTSWDSRIRSVVSNCCSGFADRVSGSSRSSNQPRLPSTEPYYTSSRVRRMALMPRITFDNENKENDCTSRGKSSAARDTLESEFDSLNSVVEFTLRGLNVVSGDGDETRREAAQQHLIRAAQSFLDNEVDVREFSGFWHALMKGYRCVKGPSNKVLPDARLISKLFEQQHSRIVKMAMEVVGTA